MTITVKFFSSFREVTGVKEISYHDVKDVKSLLEKLVEKFGSKLADQLYDVNTKRLRDSVIVLVNGHSIKLLEGMDTPLRGDDVVTTDIIAILQRVGGGVSPQTNS